MKNKIAAFFALAVLIVGTAVLHIVPILAIVAIATGDELLGLFVLLASLVGLASLAGLAYLHHLNGSIRAYRR